MKRIEKILIFWGLIFVSSCGGSGDGGDIQLNKCDASKNRCLSVKELEFCAPNGSMSRRYCAVDEACDTDACKKRICKPYAIEQCHADGTYKGCNALGTATGDMMPPPGKSCIDGDFRDRLCAEGEGRCLDEDRILTCNAGGTAIDKEMRCSESNPKTLCQNGACVPLCEKIHKSASYIGCEIWAVDLDNAIDGGINDAAGQPFSVVVSNTHPTLTANVKVFSANKSKEDYAFEIPPMELRKVLLPDNHCYEGINGPNTSCKKAYEVDGTVIVPNAFRIVSDVPVTAAQFNPLDNRDVFSNDASLLFPVEALGKRYMVMARKQFYKTFAAFVAVVAVEPGITKVTIKSSAKFGQGTDKAGRSIHAMSPGDTQIFELSQFDVLNLATNDVDTDPTGTSVEADKKIAVFAGNEATSVPETQPVTCCADHLEHQQYPLESWGKHYICARTKPRKGERELWRILAREDGTEVAFSSKVETSGGASIKNISLDAGQYTDILTKKSFEIQSTSPVLVGQFMTGQHDPQSPDKPVPDPKVTAGIGDPTYIIGVPVEQYRNDYVFLVPDKYKKNYITVVSMPDNKIRLTGNNIEYELKDYHPIEDSSYRYLYQEVTAGTYRLGAEKAVGLFVYGYDNYVSYGYPAGLDLKNITTTVTQ